MKMVLRKYSLLLIFVAILLLSTFFTKNFLSFVNISNILRQGSIVGILSIGEALVIFTGGIDLSLGSLVALASVLCATFMPSFLKVPLPTVVLVVFLFLMFFFVNTTGWGRHIYSVGGNEEVTRLAGVNVERIKMVVYTLSGFFAGLAGLIFTSRVTAGFPDSAVGYELNTIAAVIIGGVNLFGGEGNLLKVMVGAFILTIISNFMNGAGISPYTQDAVEGFIILLAVFLSLRR